MSKKVILISQLQNRFYSPLKHLKSEEYIECVGFEMSSEMCLKKRFLMSLQYNWFYLWLTDRYKNISSYSVTDH